MFLSPLWAIPICATLALFKPLENTLGQTSVCKHSLNDGSFSFVRLFDDYTAPSSLVLWVRGPFEVGTHYTVDPCLFV